jgi:hypothetical protein
VKPHAAKPHSVLQLSERHAFHDAEIAFVSHDAGGVDEVTHVVHVASSAQACSSLQHCASEQSVQA